MNSPDSVLEARILRFRPVLMTLAEALISPACRGEIDASDIVQQTCLEAHQQSRALVELDEGPFFGWLRKAMRHNLLDAVRHLKTQKNEMTRRIRISEIEGSFVRLEEILIADSTSPSAVVERNEQTARLLAAMQELTPLQKQAVILKHLQGYTLSQVAEALSVSEPAAAGLLHRGRKQLVERLERDGDE
ncbi:MAG: sigma-70 family RNA polymerase sigma factor [Planctomycetaceae bacterium]|nr:sigma-70 family RNA polymerase sigma factor [Planctomycetaceae bacterium]